MYFSILVYELCKIKPNFKTFYIKLNMFQHDMF